MMDTVTVRVPKRLAYRVDSACVCSWLADHLRQPQPHELPPDPGPGDGRVSLSLPRRMVRTLAAMHDVPVSVALRRLMAEWLAVLPAPVAAPELPSGGVSVALAPRSPPTRATLPARRGESFQFDNRLALSINQQRARLGLPPLPQPGASTRAKVAGSARAGLWVILGAVALVIVAIAIFGSKSGGPPAPSFRPWMPVA